MLFTFCAIANLIGPPISGAIFSSNDGFVEVGIYAGEFRKSFERDGELKSWALDRMHDFSIVSVDAWSEMVSFRRSMAREILIWRCHL